MSDKRLQNRLLVQRHVNDTLEPTTTEDSTGPTIHGLKKQVDIETAIRR